MTGLIIVFRVADGGVLEKRRKEECYIPRKGYIYTGVCRMQVWSYNCEFADERWFEKKTDK